MMLSYTDPEGMREPASLSFFPASAHLLPFLTGYWVVRDLGGLFAGATVTTCTGAGVLLSVSFGRPNEVLDGEPIPKTAMLGLQPKSRQWISRGDTFYIMTYLTPLGIARLFPEMGRDTIGALFEVAALLGDREASALARRLPAWLDDAAIADEMDLWFCERLEAVAEPFNFNRLTGAHRTLLRTGSVAAAAEAAGVSRRQFSRWHMANHGVGAKQVLDLHRIRSSLRSAQLGRGDALAGFADQAHQIRTWKARLGITPGAYSRTGPSDFARLTNSLGASTLFL